MDCNFPALNWARLGFYPDELAEVFDMDGKTHPFASAQEARFFLGEDEFTSWDPQDEMLEEELGQPLASMAPPVGETAEALLPQMYVQAHSA